VKVGDLVRFKEIIRHDYPEVLTDWQLGVMIAKEYNLVKVLNRNGEVKTIYSYLVQKAGKKDKETK
jgi:hypothetical protein